LAVIYDLSIFNKGVKIMAKNKTAETAISVSDFINAYVDNDQKKMDSFRLIELMGEWSGSEAKMWGPTIVGFGSYHYKYESGHEGDAPLIAFSPRKADFSLYIYTATEEHRPLLENLGKFKIGIACIYVKKLSDIDIAAAEKICKATIAYLNGRYPTS
jgi:hypothetical protein